MFNNTSHEEGFAEIPMNGIDGATMELILLYIYTRQTDIDCDNVLDVMRVADYLRIDGLVQLSHVFAVESLAPANCVDLLHFAVYVTIDARRRCVAPTAYNKRALVCPTFSCYNFGELRDEAYGYIVKNFVTLAENCDGLLDLGHEQLGTIIGHEQLNARYEEAVWEFVVKWIDRDPENREDRLVSLLPNIRFGLMDFDYFSYCVTIRFPLYFSRSAHLGRSYY